MHRIAATLVTLASLLAACASPVETESASADALSAPPGGGSSIPGPRPVPRPRPYPRPLPPCTDVTCAGPPAPSCAMTDMIEPNAILDYQVESCAWLSCGTGTGGDYTSTSYLSPRCGGTHEEIVELFDLPATGAPNVTAGVNAGINATTGFDPANDPYVLHVVVWGHAAAGWLPIADLSTPSAASSPEYAIDLSSMFQQGFAGYDLVRIGMQASNTDANGVLHWDPVGFGLNDPRYVRR